MQAYKTAGIVENLMSALSLLVVRDRTRVGGPKRRSPRPDGTGRASALDAVRRKEIYGQMARQPWWNR